MWRHSYILILFLNGANPAFFVYFPSFLNTMTNTVHFNQKWKKRRCCAWDSNQGPQDGRHRWIHWAMVAPVFTYTWMTSQECIESFQPRLKLHLFAMLPKPQFQSFAKIIFLPLTFLQISASKLSFVLGAECFKIHSRLWMQDLQGYNLCFD